MSTLKSARVKRPSSSERQVSTFKQKKLDALKILLVDGAKDNRMFIQAFLKNSPHYLVMAEDGLEAVEKFKTDVFDLVLMDI
ncbi:response regulator [Magnetococcales bacterium HHB-1]